MTKFLGRVKTTARVRAWKQAKNTTFLVLRAAADTFEFFDAARGRYRYVLIHQGLEGVRRVESERRRRAIVARARELRRRGLLEAKKIGNRLCFSLTKKGEAALLRNVIRRSPPRKDRRRVIVLFDVPERERASRGLLRHLLKSSGFTRLQQSVWVTEKDVAREFSTWLKINDLGKWVKIMIAEEFA